MTTTPLKFFQIAAADGVLYCLDSNGTVWERHRNWEHKPTWQKVTPSSNRGNPHRSGCHIREVVLNVDLGSRPPDLHLHRVKCGNPQRRLDE